MHTMFACLSEQNRRPVFEFYFSINSKSEQWKVLWKLPGHHDAIGGVATWRRKLLVQHLECTVYLAPRSIFMFLPCLFPSRISGILFYILQLFHNYSTHLSKRVGRGVPGVVVWSLLSVLLAEGPKFISNLSYCHGSPSLNKVSLSFSHMSW